MTHSAMLPPMPLVDPDSAPFWEALKAGRLEIARCRDTGKRFHPPLERSPFTGGEIDFEEVSGRGQIFSFIVVRQQTVPGHQTPYVVAVVELQEQKGLRLTGIVRAEPDDVRIGAAVLVETASLGETGFVVPEFILADPDPDDDVGSR